MVDFVGDRGDFPLCETVHLIAENPFFFAEVKRRERHCLRGLGHAPVEREQALPMALGGGLVIAPAPRKGEAVMDAGMNFELAGDAGFP